jgi:hypothetical protein
MIEDDTLRSAFLAPSCVSKWPIPISKLGMYLSQYLDFRFRHITISWWLCALVEDKVQEAGISPFAGPLVLPWEEVVKEIGDPLSLATIGESTWSAVTSNPLVMKASVRLSTIPPIYRTPKGYEGAEYGAIVQRRYFNMCATRVSHLIV